jgi:F-type H+-transporting ATPase subunit epsilon
MDKLTIELVSPEKLLLSEQVEMVVLPGEEGDFALLHNHAPIISTLRPGSIAIFEDSKVIRRYFVSGGFVEMHDNRCVILADNAEMLDDMDKADIQAALDAAEKDGNLDTQYINICKAKLAAINSPAYA